MMNKVWRLYLGELQRLVKYKIIFFTMIASLMWIAIIILSDTETARGLVPILMVTDAGMMAVLLLGASFYFEKQEGTIKSLLVSPARLSQLLIAKVASAVTMGLLSMILLGGSAWIFQGISVNFLILAIYIIIIVGGNTAIGYLFILKSKDFMGMIVKFAGVMLLFYAPVLLVALQIIPEEFDFLALLSPVSAGSLLIESLYGTVSIGKVLFSVFYLTALTVTLYPFVVYKKYQKVAVEG